MNRKGTMSENIATIRTDIEYIKQGMNRLENEQEDMNNYISRTFTEVFTRVKKNESSLDKITGAIKFAGFIIATGISIAAIIVAAT